LRAKVYDGAVVPVARAPVYPLLSWEPVPMRSFIRHALPAAVLALPLSALAAEPVVPADPAAPAIAKKEAKGEAPAKHAKDLEKTKQAAAENITVVSVEGMMCAACQAKVKAALEKVDGVKHVKAVSAAGKAYVSLKPKAELTQDAAVKALAELKEFKVTGVAKAKIEKSEKPEKGGSAPAAAKKMQALKEDNN